MAKSDTFTVSLIEGLSYDGRKRGVAFLECATDKAIDAKTYFDKLNEKQKGDFRNRFEYWMDGGVCDKYFHGFTSYENYRLCFVFKLKKAGTHHRLYGFLINPKASDPSYQACVLVSHAQKNTAETNPSELEGAERLRENSDVIAAVKKTRFEDPPKKGART